MSSLQLPPRTKFTLIPLMMCNYHKFVATFTNSNSLETFLHSLSTKKPSNIPILVKKAPSTIESSDVESNYTKRSSSSSGARPPLQFQPRREPKKTTKDPKTPTTKNELESVAFGPKIKIRIPHSSRSKRRRFGQSKSSSRVSTPTSEPEVLNHRVSRQGKKFRQHVSVEDLAYRDPGFNPISGLVRELRPASRRADESSRAFVVLDNKLSLSLEKDRISQDLYKEQKWMPSWYNPTR